MAEYMPADRVIIRHESKEHADKSVLFNDFRRFWEPRGWKVRGDTQPKLAHAVAPEGGASLADTTPEPKKS